MYPDNDQLLEDKSLILNAIEFATGERAFAAEMLIRQPLDAYDERHLAYLAAQAYTRSHFN